MEATLSVQSTWPSPRIFYGWLVVAAAFAVTFVGFGCAYTFSAFVEPLQRNFGASRGSVSLVFSLAGFLYFGLGIVSGPLADRFGSRRLAVAGMILTGLGLAAAGAARSLTEVYAAYGLGVGLGVGCSYVPAVGAVQRWFVRRRGLASGLAVSGIGVGTLVMPPLAALLIAALGWRLAYLALGGLAAIVGAGMALLIENDPHERGLGPDRDPPPTRTRSPGPPGAAQRAAGRAPSLLRPPPPQPDRRGRGPPGGPRPRGLPLHRQPPVPAADPPHPRPPPRRGGHQGGHALGPGAEVRPRR